MNEQAGGGAPLRGRELIAKGFLDSDDFRQPIPTSRDDEPDPDRIGAYRVVRRLGQGAMGRVYLVEDGPSKRLAALKLLRADPTLVSEDVLKRFWREAEALVKVRHPNVLRLYRAGTIADVGPFLLLEHLEGVSLDVVSHRGPLTPYEAARVAGALTGAVQALHDVGLLHRDVKPANVVLRCVGQVPVLLDFGLARDSNAETLTKTGALLGTPAYMAPEQARGAPFASLDATVDVYGLGCVLYHLLVGAPPFDGPLIQVIHLVSTRDPVWPSARVPGVDGQLDAICRRAMHKDPSQRYPTARAMGDDLARFLEGAPSPRWPGGLVPGPAPTHQPATTHSERTPAPRSKTRTHFGPYPILRKLGRGGCGVVYAVRDSELDRDVALKVLLPDFDLESNSLDRFEREALAMAQLRHPNIVTVFSVKRLENKPCLVLELVEGESLKARIAREGPLGDEESVRIVSAVTRAIQHAHEHGIVHRDIKPANILMDERGRPRLTDFGLAKRAEDERLTRTGAVVGTPSYLPPEQVGGAQLDARSDVYGLGATLYACLTGRAPFLGNDAIHILAQVVSTEPPAPRDLCPDVDRALEAICLRCLSKKPDQRYPTAAALAEALEERVAPPQQARRSWIPFVLGALAVVGISAGALIAAGDREPDPSETPPPPQATTPEEPQTPLRDVAGLAPVERRDALTDWLREHPDHPRAEAVRAELRRIWLEIPRLELRHKGLRAAGFAQGGAVTAGGTSVILWDLPSGQERWHHVFDSEIHTMAVTPQGDGCLVSRVGEKLDWIDLPTRQVRLLSPYEARPGLGSKVDRPLNILNLNEIRISPDGRRAVVGNHHTPTVVVLEVPSGRIVRSWRLGHSLRRAEFGTASDSVAILPWNDTGPWVLDIRPLEGPGSRSVPIPVRPMFMRRLGMTGKLVIAHKAPIFNRDAGWLKLYDRRGEEIGAFLRGKDGESLQSSHEDAIFGLACAPDGQRVFSASRYKQGKLKVWTPAGRLIHEASAPFVVWKLEAGPDGQVLQNIGPNDPVLLWDFSGLD